jgi:hypothetical protein
MMFQVLARQWRACLFLMPLLVCGCSAAERVAALTFISGAATAASLAIIDAVLAPVAFLAGFSLASGN